MNFSQFLDAAHISTLNCDEMAENRPRLPAYKFFSIKHKFSSLSPDADGCHRPRYPLKSGYFIAVISCIVKTIADRYIHAAYRNKQ